MPPLLTLSHPLGIWAYVVIAVLVMVEGPVATLVGAVAASAGYLKPGWVFFSAAAGNLTSDTLWYLLGYLGNIEWVVKYGRYVRLKRSQVDRLQAEIQKHVLQILFVAKLTMGFVIPVLVATGLAKIPIRRWFGVLVTAEAIWTGALVYTGYHFGHYIRTLERGMQYFALGGTLIFVILLLQFINKRRDRSTEAEETPEES